jgi:minor extracellular serine protease Vpr
MRRLLLALLLLPASWARVIPDRYIVELTGEPVAGRVAAQGRHPNEIEAIERRAEVSSEQVEVRAAIERQGGEILASAYMVANALMVRMPAGVAARVASLPGVKRVHAVREFKPVLDHAVVVHKITDAWNQIGLTHAGLGIKIAMIDTGIDNTHPGFQDPSLAIPKGFPKTNQASDTTFTNNKVIVARSYAKAFFSTDPDLSARDDQGHGTATAMAAAGVLNSGALSFGPQATIRGVAPEAYLGNYKVFGSPGVTDFAPEDAILKAIDDAVADGMDIINLSLGDAVAVALDQDLEVSAIQNATSLGAIVVVAAGNSGPDPHTIGSPANAPAAISVGASSNERLFNNTATVGGKAYQAIEGSGPAPSQPVTAGLKDVAALDGSGLACSTLKAGSLQGKVALILRGTCFFSDKLTNAQAAGAKGALVYTDAARPDAIFMEVRSATLPAMMVSYSDGAEIKQRLAANPSFNATLDFSFKLWTVNPDQLAMFSAQGPNVDASIKPEMVAVGQYVFTAAEKSNSKGEVYSPSGYALLDGTSFSAPIVAGAAALLKEARPGLTVAEYRSLLIHSAGEGFVKPEFPARAQQAGAGMLDMSAALRATAAASPVSLSFGAGTGDVQSSQKLTIFNVGQAAETFSIFAVAHDGPSEPVPPGSRTGAVIETAQPVVTVSTHSLTLNAGAKDDIVVSMTGFGLPAGAYEGFIHVVGATSGVDERVPYWYGVGSPVPARITVLETVNNPKAGSVKSDAILFRVTDAAGITVPGVKPVVTVVAGGGSVGGVANHDDFEPGVFGVTLTLGPTAGPNDFQVQVGALKQTVTIVSQ